MIPFLVKLSNNNKQETNKKQTNNEQTLTKMTTLTFSLTFDGTRDFMAGPLMKNVLRTREDRYLANIKWLDEDLGEKLEEQNKAAMKIQKFARQKLARRLLPQEVDDEVLGPFVVRLTPENVSVYIGMEIQFGTRSGKANGFINSVSKSGKTIQIDHAGDPVILALNNSLGIVSRRVLVRAHTATTLAFSLALGEMKLRL